MMTTIIKEKSTIKIGKEPMVILPLKKWEEIEEMLEDFEDMIRFNKAFKESRGEKMISLKELKRKYSLKS
ncbi:MAG: hypothetical protein WBC21_01985 [Minisyncoccales bacterium]